MRIPIRKILPGSIRLRRLRVRPRRINLAKIMREGQEVPRPMEPHKRRQDLRKAELIGNPATSEPKKAAYVQDIGTRMNRLSNKNFVTQLAHSLASAAVIPTFPATLRTKIIQILKHNKAKIKDWAVITKTLQEKGLRLG